MMVQSIIFDIDGTLANIDHRRPILKKDPYNWEGFFAEMGEDKLNTPITDLYKELMKSEFYECIVVSARPERYRKITENWLIWNGLEYKQLLLRPNDDARPDSQIKLEMLRILKKQNRKIAFVIDDRQSVVDMWRENGITCLQCADHDF